MNWFRRHLKHGSRLALLALAIQLALSFGHFHGTTVHAAPEQAGLSAADFAVAAEEARSDAAQQRPTDHDDDHRQANACAICAVISLAYNLLFATPPLLQLPQAIALLRLTTDAEFAHLGTLQPPFRSRAPPAS